MTSSSSGRSAAQGPVDNRPLILPNPKTFSMGLHHGTEPSRSTRSPLAELNQPSLTRLNLIKPHPTKQKSNVDILQLYFFEDAVLSFKVISDLNKEQVGVRQYRYRSLMSR